jgi:hypothetical protein
MNSETPLVGFQCSDCQQSVICAADPEDADLRCPACAARDAAAIELSVALRVRMLSGDLREASAGIEDRGTRKEIRRAARELRQLAAHLALRHGIGGDAQ